MTQRQGKILQGIGGFYYVESGGTVYTCKARGLFRKQRITPLAGDEVLFAADENEGVISDILPRRNSLVRPPVANLDCLVIAVSTVSPLPVFRVIDTMIAIAEDKEIEPLIVVTKTDLEKPDDIREVYAHIGIPYFEIGEDDLSGINDLKETIGGRVCVFSGNSGVGKSTLLNRLDIRLSLETGEISEKLGRGRHTTRSVCLYPWGGGYIADTPGFSQIDILKTASIPKENLIFCFRDLLPFAKDCRFTSCAHTGETGCAVSEAVESGKAYASRLESYRELYRSSDVDVWKK